MIIWIALSAQICNDILQISMIFLPLKFYVEGLSFMGISTCAGRFRFGVVCNDASSRDVGVVRF